MLAGRAADLRGDVQESKLRAACCLSLSAENRDRSMNRHTSRMLISIAAIFVVRIIEAAGQPSVAEHLRANEPKPIVRRLTVLAVADDSYRRCFRSSWENRIRGIIGKASPYFEQAFGISVFDSRPVRSIHRTAPS